MTSCRTCVVVAAVALAAAACQQPTPSSRSTEAKVEPPAAVAVAPAVLPAAKPAPPVALPNRDFLPGPLYYCAVGEARTEIAYEPKVESLCRRHPEMGPCQFERNQCRAKGGRVFTARGEEVSPGVEAEYDKAVMRVRFQADGGKR